MKSREYHKIDCWPFFLKVKKSAKFCVERASVIGERAKPVRYYQGVNIRAGAILLYICIEVYVQCMPSILGPLFSLFAENQRNSWNQPFETVKVLFLPTFYKRLYCTSVLEMVKWSVV